MAEAIIDGKPITLPEGQQLNGIQAARLAGVEIPHYCWHPGLSVVASCRMCLVECGTRDAESGEVRMLPKLVPACQTPVRDGTVLVTDSPKVRHARAYVEEALLIDHPIDCPVCDKAGECYLQDYYFKHGQPKRRADLRPFHSRKRDLGPTVRLFVDRCVMCSRCVRFCREVAGTGELMVVHRGSHEEIDVFPGHPLANKLSGNVVELCPVGALGDKDFLYKQRVWFLKSHAGICTGCSVGCNIWIDENQDHIYRLRARENPHVNQWWICDEGRYGFHHVHSEKRLLGFRHRPEQGPEQELDWEQARDLLQQWASESSRAAAVVSPHLTVEEAYLLCRFVRQVDAEAPLVLGPVPRSGQDEHFPGGFTIRAEKCPNRRGVVELLQHFGGQAGPWPEGLQRLLEYEPELVWVSGGYKTDWITPQEAEQLAQGRRLVVQDLFPSPASQAARLVLPGAAFTEKSGSYVNHNGRLQWADWAIRPPVGTRPEGAVLWQLLGRSGLYQPEAVLEEIAAEVVAFQAVTLPVPEQGVDLHLSLLAEEVTPSAEPPA